MRVGIERVVVTLLLWATSLVPWWWLMQWTEAGRKEAARSGIFIDPGELTISLPFWLLIVAYYVARPVVARLERFWERRGW
jgi:hypothetical protein